MVEAVNSHRSLTCYYENGNKDYVLEVKPNGNYFLNYNENHNYQWGLIYFKDQNTFYQYIKSNSDEQFISYNLNDLKDYPDCSSLKGAVYMGTAILLAPLMENLVVLIIVAK